MDERAIRRAALITLHRAINERIQHAESSRTAWTHRSTGSRISNVSVPRTSPTELATAAQACRAMAHQEGEALRYVEKGHARGKVVLTVD
jgi:hypothetical protein